MRIVGSEDKAKDGCLYIRCKDNCFGIGAHSHHHGFGYLALKYKDDVVPGIAYSHGVGYYTLELDQQESEDFITCMLKFFEECRKEL